MSSSVPGQQNEIELGHVMSVSVSVSVTQEKVTDAHNVFAFAEDGQSSEYENSVKGGAAV